MESNHRTFRRLADGKLGVGFIFRIGGAEQACIAWPDHEPRKYAIDSLERFGIEVLPQAMSRPAETMTSRTIDTGSNPDASESNVENDPGEVGDQPEGQPGGAADASTDKTEQPA